MTAERLALDSIEGTRTTIFRKVPAPIFSSPLVKSAAASLILTAEISAFGLIRKVKVVAGRLETFFKVKTALTVKFLSVSFVG